MDSTGEHASEPLTSAFDIVPADRVLPMDDVTAADLHRAINERRAQVENPELLRRLRSL